MKKRIILIILIGLSFGINGQEKVQTENGLKTDFIYKNGNVGIGTNSPEEIFEIKSSNPVVTFHSTGIASFKVGNDGDVFKIAAMDNGFGGHIGNFNANDSQTISMKTNGNVGIGTTSPQTPLDVKGIIKSTDGVGNTLFLSSSVSGSYIRMFGSQNFSLRNTAGTSKINFNVESGGATFPGKVGIGTITPDNDAKLTVAGSIHSREVKVTDTAGGADFVFENDYNLPSLKTVESYIKENKHLPEIASAKEMDKNGLNLAEMNIKLLQKIEELTLYTIEQEKKIKKQGLEIETLKYMEERLTKIEVQLKKKN